MALSGIQSNPYMIKVPEPQQPQQGGGGGSMNPMMLQSLMSKGGATGTAGATGVGATGAGGASGGAGSAITAAGPWAALAAVIIGNEYGATEAGRRTEGTQYAKDLLGGKVISQDAPYYADKVFGDDDYGFGAEAVAGSELLSLDFSNAWDSLKEGTVGKLIGKIF